MMKKIFVFMLLLGSFMVFVFWVSTLGTDPWRYINEIETGYYGTVIEIYQDRTINLKIRTDNNKLIDVGGLCSDFVFNVSVNDTIEKIANENYVFIIRGDEKIKKPYLYIHKRIRSSKKWPKDWKEKWPESTY
jgi:hypothetical protein